MSMGAATRRLVLAWAAMAVLTGAAVIFGHAGSHEPLGGAMMAALLALTGAKAAILAHHYLDLRHGPAWNAAMRISVALLLAIVLGLSLIAGRA